MSEIERFGEWSLAGREGRSGPFLSCENWPQQRTLIAANIAETLKISLHGISTHVPIAAIERLLALRRAALAPEAHAPSGEPWRPAVGEECLYYINGEWRQCKRVEDGEEDHRFARVNGPDRLIHCPPTYDGIRPLGSLPAPPSCGGELEAREQAERPAVASERPGLARLLEWARGAEREADRSRRVAHLHEKIRLHENRQDAYADCVREIEQEIAALGPPSIAEDLRAPEPGSFEGAELVPGAEVAAPCPVCGNEERSAAGYLLCECPDPEVTARLTREREVSRAAVCEALAGLRDEFVRAALYNKPADHVHGLAFATEALDRLAERFK